MPKRRFKKKNEKSYYLDIIEEDINYYKNVNLYPRHKQQVSYTIKPKNKNQSLYLNALHNDNIKIIVVIGPAGTGKTFMGCNYGFQNFQENYYSKLVITRPVVSNDEEIGFLPGTLESKMAPWLKPITDVFEKTMHKTQIENLMTDNSIEVCPLAFMRGRTFDSTFIFADEMQNSTISQMKMLLTRIGNESKLIITGDLLQNDLKNQVNGLEDLIHRLHINCPKSISIIKFNNDDIERSEIVKDVLSLY